MVSYHGIDKFLNYAALTVIGLCLLVGSVASAYADFCYYDYGPDELIQFDEAIDDPAFIVNFPKFQNDIEKIIWVNGYVNHLFKYHYTNDMIKPSKALLAGGDCKDYSLTKYLLLRRLGFSPDQLAVTGITIADEHAGHAVLLVWSGGRMYILDSIREAGHFAPIRNSNSNYVFAPGDFLMNENAIRVYR